MGPVERIARALALWRDGFVRPDAETRLRIMSAHSLKKAIGSRRDQQRDGPQISAWHAEHFSRVRTALGGESLSVFTAGVVSVIGPNRVEFWLVPKGRHCRAKPAGAILLGEYPLLMHYYETERVTVARAQAVFAQFNADLPEITARLHRSLRLHMRLVEIREGREHSAQTKRALHLMQQTLAVLEQLAPRPNSTYEELVRIPEATGEPVSS